MEIKELVQKAHEHALEKGFYDGKFNFAEKLMLVVSELGELLEAHRTEKRFVRDFYEPSEPSDDLIAKLETMDVYAIERFEEMYKDQLEDEFADILIRLTDLCGYFNINIEKHLKAKIAYNKSREYKHGKMY